MEEESGHPTVSRLHQHEQTIRGQTRGYDAQQAYALCSVAVDLRISQTVDVPNLMVTAILPLDIFA